MNIAYALEKIINRLYEQEKIRAEKYIKKYHDSDHSRVNELNMHLDKCNIDLISFHVPTFVYQFSSDTQYQLYKIINGYTGEIEGDTFYSPIKSFLAGSVLGGMFGIMLGPFIGGPVFLTLLLSRAAIGGMIGVPPMLWAKFQHIYKVGRSIDQNTEELKYNETFQETQEDIQRKLDSDEFSDTKT